MSEVPKMPWRGIAKITGAFGGGLTLLCWAMVRGERQRIEDDNRYRWNDKNRWE